MTPEQMLAREAIRYTMSVYNNAGDRGQMDEMMTAFAEDGTLETPQGAAQGRDKIKEFLMGGVKERKGRAATDKRVFLRHNLTTSRIELMSETEANAWTYFIVVTEAGLAQAGVYVDQYAKHGDRWLIAKRRVKVDLERPEFRQGLADA